VRERSGAPARQHLLDGFRKRRLIERSDRDTERTPQRPIARAPGDPFQGVVPERHPSTAVDDRHALVDRFEDLTPPVLVFEPVHVAAVRAIGAINRDRDDRQQLPCAVIEDFDQPDSNSGADEIVRRIQERGLRPLTIDRCLGHERRDHFR
jgi:hypothetical protein